MARLGSLAKLIRSKNAGPWMLTIDIMFPDSHTYRSVLETGVLSAQLLGEMFGIDHHQVQIFHYDPANAIKVSFPRRYPNGHPLDTDAFGGQQFAPLVALEIPLPEPDPVLSAAGS